MKGIIKAMSLAGKATLLLICLVMVVPIIINLCPSLVGADASYTVLSGSMQPTLYPGDLAFTATVDASEIEGGDVVLVRDESKVYMHRVLEKVESNDGVLFRLKGDACEDPDPTLLDA